MPDPSALSVRLNKLSGLGARIKTVRVRGVLTNANPAIRALRFT